MQLLIIEDEIRLADALGQIMEEAGYLADVVYSGEDGLNYALCGLYDVIVLDLMLPGMDGFSIVKKLRDKKIYTPILILTARYDIHDKIHGLDYGADDYMTKPFIPEELLARIRALSRRQGDMILDTLTFADLTLQLSTNELQCRDKSIHLGFKEFEIMKILISHAQIITSKELMLSKVWGVDSQAEDNNVEAYISFLRKKLTYLGSNTGITTIRKVGYRLEETV